MSFLDGIASIGWSIAEMLTFGAFKSPLTRQAEKPVRMPKTYAQIRADYYRRRDAHWREWMRRNSWENDA